MGDDEQVVVLSNSALLVKACAARLKARPNEGSALVRIGEIDALAAFDPSTATDEDVAALARAHTVGNVWTVIARLLLGDAIRIRLDVRNNNKDNAAYADEIKKLESLIGRGQRSIEQYRQASRKVFELARTHA